MILKLKYLTTRRLSSATQTPRIVLCHFRELSKMLDDGGPTQGIL